MILEYIKNNCTEVAIEALKLESTTTRQIIRAMESALVFNQPSIGLDRWSKVDPTGVLQLTFVLDKLGLARTRVSKNYNEIAFKTELLDKGLLEDWRNLEKVKLYSLREDTKVYPTNLTKVNGKLIDTGLVREGFAKVAKQTFKLDTKYLAKYRRPILQNLIKGITKSVEKGFIKEKYFADASNYSELANILLDHYIANPDAKYNSERNMGESRGRSNLLIQRRIGNWITYKDFRACLKSTEVKVLESSHTEELNAIYYFIAELVGNKATTEEEVIKAGKEAYEERHLPRLDLKSINGRKDLHELIYLERIYAKLDKLNKWGFMLWDIPLEID